MNKLDTSAVSNTVGMPIKGKTLSFLMDGAQKAIECVAAGYIGGANYDPSIPYILWGCEPSGTDPGGRTITDGAILFNGEVFEVDEANFNTAGSQVAVGTITTTFYAVDGADPVMFTDLQARQVHQIRKVVFDAGLAGSGDFNYNSAVNLKHRPVAGIGQVIMWNLPGSESTYFDNTGLGIHPLTTGFAKANGNNGTIDWGGYVPVGHKPGDSDFGTIGTPGGSKTTTLTSNQQGNFKVKVKNDDTSGGTQPNIVAQIAFNGADVANNGASNQGGYGTESTVTLSDAPNGHSNLQPFRVALFIQRIA